jgi:RNA polymerase sigma-70 factor (ECF subfamily)
MELSVLEIEQLVVRAQRGQENAFSELFDYFYPKILRYISFRVNQEDVEDLVSEVFLRVVDKMKRYQKTTKGNFSAWVFRIAHNLVIDFYRQQKEYLRLTDPETGELQFDIPDNALNPHDSAVQHEEHRKIRGILKKLSDTHREVLQLKFLEGFSNPEIAEIIGKSEGNVRVIQLRALRELRKHFSEGEL